MTSLEQYKIELNKSCSNIPENLPSIIKEVPNIFKTLESLLKEKDLNNTQRLQLFAAIGYFFVPDDLFPEEKLGEIGYIDDILLALTILKSIYETHQGEIIIQRHWFISISKETIFKTELTNLISKYPNEYFTVLNHFGLLPDEFDIDTNDL